MTANGISTMLYHPDPYCCPIEIAKLEEHEHTIPMASEAARGRGTRGERFVACPHARVGDRALAGWLSVRLLTCPTLRWRLKMIKESNPRYAPRFAAFATFATKAVGSMALGSMVGFNLLFCFSYFLISFRFLIVILIIT